MPNEYEINSEVIADTNPEWNVMNGLLITKGNKNIPIATPLPVDGGCEIEVTVRNNVGIVKYLKSTNRRKYYKAITYISIVMQIIALILLTYEIEINNNYAIEGSPNYYLLLPSIASWLILSIPLLRNAKGFTKWVLTIFGYILLALNIHSFIMYIISIL